MTDTAVIDPAIELAQAYKNLHPAVITDLKVICHPDKPSFLPKSDPLTTAFREGQRSVWLHMEKYINLDDWRLREDIKNREKNYVR